jgi:hypothetical protein
MSYCDEAQPSSAFLTWRSAEPSALSLRTLIGRQLHGATRGDDLDTGGVQTVCVAVRLVIGCYSSGLCPTVGSSMIVQVVGNNITALK